MPKLTDEQIMQALDGCIKPNKSYSCAECQYYNKTANCVKNLMKDTLDLINRLKEDNEKLQEENRIKTYQKNQRDKEITALQRQIKGLHIYENRIKNEAYKEFAEEFINYIDVGHLRDASEICLSELNVKNMVENFLKQKVGE